MDGEALTSPDAETGLPLARERGVAWMHSLGLVTPALLIMGGVGFCACGAPKDMNIEFEQHFASWLDESLGQDIPDTVEAFCFNLWEPAGQPGVEFAIELIGTGACDEDDPDWPCDEVWEPVPRTILIPIDYSGDEWQSCRHKLKALVLKHLETESPAIQKLKSSQGIGIGFVDGDLEVIWKPG